MRNNFANRLRYLAKNFGGSSKLAKSLGLTPQSLQNYLTPKGKKEKPSIPGGELLALIAEITGCDGNWLLTGEGTPFRPNLAKIWNVFVINNMIEKQDSSLENIKSISSFTKEEMKLLMQDALRMIKQYSESKRASLLQFTQILEKHTDDDIDIQTIIRLIELVYNNRFQK